MTNKKYAVPEGMVLAAVESLCKVVGYPHPAAIPETIRNVRIALEESVHWLAENPIVPTNEQVEAIHVEQYDSTEDFLTVSKKNMAVEWQRQMFLSPKSRIPEAVEDLWIDENSISFYKGDPEAIAARGNRAILEAYRRGREGR